MTFKKSLIFLATATALGVATGCSDDDDNGGNNNNNDDTAESFQQQFLDSSNASNIMEADPQLNGKFAADSGQADLGSNQTVGSFFTDTSFIGAVDPDASTAWWEGWTLHEGSGSLESDAASTLTHPLWDNIAGNGTLSYTPATASGGDACADSNGTVSDGSTYPTDLTLGNGNNNQTFPVCVISSDFDADATLSNDYAYVLDGIIHFGPQAADNDSEAHSSSKNTLTIAEGAQIFGATEKNSGLIITRNAKVDVQGTADAPVVMSSLDTDSNGDYVSDLSGTDASNGYFSGVDEWGGLVIDGYASINSGDEALTEVAPDGTERYFGGSKDDDDSGSLSHLVIAESGGEFRPDEEIQGLTLEGVGSGTSIDHVQVHHSGDDGIEWFGGTVNATHLLITGAQDDSFDMDLGFQGKIQYAMARQAAEWGNRTIESDNNGDDFDAEPMTMPTFVNVTLIGNSNDDADTTGALHREGMAGNFHQMIITDDADGDGYSEGCLDIDDTTARIDDGNLAYENVIMNCAAGKAVEADD
jgi:hypothetical protein